MVCVTLVSKLTDKCNSAELEILTVITDGCDPAELEAVLRIHDILGWFRIRGSTPLTNESGSGSWILDPDPAIFIIDLQDASKKLIF
jgi:hypothetical protein